MEASYDKGRSITAQCLAVLVMGCGAVAAVAAQGYVGLDAGFQRGAFSSSVTTSVTSLTMSGGWFGDDYDVFAAVPLLHLSDNFGADETGLGDIIVRVSRSNLYHNTDGLTFGASVSIKLPTADESKNLGSGETDIGGFVNLRKQWLSFDTTVGVGYLVVGDPAGTDYNNVTFVSIAISKQLSRGGVFASLDGRSAVITGTDAPRELGFGGYYVVNAQHAFSSSAFVGLSDGSADYGLNLGWLRRF